MALVVEEPVHSYSYNGFGDDPRPGATNVPIKMDDNQIEKYTEQAAGKYDNKIGPVHFKVEHGLQAKHRIDKGQNGHNGQYAENEDCRLELPAVKAPDKQAC